MTECAAVFFFFFQQKTAYEMRISDWSSDVVSSDLIVRKGGHYSRTVNGSEEELSGPVAVDSLWSKDRLTAGKLFSAVSDEVYRVRSDLMGTETIEAKGGPVEAEHYKLSGELDRDLWYSPEGELLKMKYESEDGETFEFVRR